MLTTIRKRWIDASAMGISLLCLAHCLALPVLLVLAPAFTSQLLGDDAVIHAIFLIFAVPLTAIGLWVGFRGRVVGPAVVGAGWVGLVLLGVGLTLGDGTAWSTALTSTGAAIILSMHYINWNRRTKRHHLHRDRYHHRAS